ncbi:MAG: hypothetical protein ABJZ55_00150 [Fuerstiella sp.]
MPLTQLELLQQEITKQDSSAEPSADAVLVALQKTLINQKDYHRLFDALMMQARLEMKLPLAKPASMTGVPEDLEGTFRNAYVKSARKVGALFLKDNLLSDAWAYFRTINEPQPIKAAIEKLTVPEEPDEQFDELVNLALYEGAHVVKGLEFLLATHGTCNTVTALSQLQAQMSAEDRRAAAKLMVQTIYDELIDHVRGTIASERPGADVTADLAKLVREHSWLFDGGSYHIDVSHLHSTVGFARALTAQDGELALAVQLCAYGRQLDAPLQYPGDIPFDEFYIGNQWFLNAIAGTEVDDAVAYFVKRLKDEPDEPDRRLISMVILDLAERADRLPTVLPHVLPHVGEMEDPNGFSFTEMCVDLKLHDALEQLAQQNDDPLAWTIARLTRTTKA